MSEVKWIKIVVDIFDDEKIKLIESLPDGDRIIVCWFKLLCLAGKTNNSGVLFLADKLPYTEEMLATIFRRPIQTVRLALSTFEQFGMIEIINGVITIPNWEKHQQLDKMEKVRGQTRDRVNRYRERQKLLTECNVTETLHVTQCNGTDIDIDKDKEVDKEITTTMTADAEVVLQKWNELGFNGIRNIVPGSEREKLLKARIKENGIESVLEAIDKIKKSDFLHGQNKNNWTIFFDWFIRPRNFLKVLEGNYDNRGENNASRTDTRSAEESAKKWNIHYD